MKINIVRQSVNDDISKCEPLYFALNDTDTLTEMGMEISVYEYYKGKKSAVLESCDGYIFYNKEAFVTNKPYILIDENMSEDDTNDQLSKLITLLMGENLDEGQSDECPFDLGVNDETVTREDIEWSEPDSAGYVTRIFPDKIDPTDVFVPDAFPAIEEGITSDNLITEENLYSDTTLVGTVTNLNVTCSTAISELGLSLIGSSIPSIPPALKGIVMSYKGQEVTLNKEDIGQLVRLHEAMKDYGFDFKEVIFG